MYLNIKQLTLLCLFAKAESDFKTLEIELEKTTHVASQDTIDINNKYSTTYTGMLYFGGSKKNSKHTPAPLRMIFDTGSPTMWVQGTQCDGKCTGDKTEYDVNDSYDAHFLKKKGKKIDANMKYGSG